MNLFRKPAPEFAWDDVPATKPWLDPTNDDLWDANGEPNIAKPRRDFVGPITKAAKIAFVALSISLAFVVGTNVGDTRPTCYEDEVVIGDFGQPLECVHIDALR